MPVVFISVFIYYYFVPIVIIIMVEWLMRDWLQFLFCLCNLFIFYLIF